MRFAGTFDYAMDERGRVPLPPVYRDAFEAGVVLSQGRPDPCLRLLTVESYQRISDEHTADSPMLNRGRVLRRAFFPNVRVIEVDRQHRILIPAGMREYAGLKRQVLLMGMGDSLEIWDPETWEAEDERVMSHLEATMESTERRIL